MRGGLILAHLRMNGAFDEIISVEGVGIEVTWRNMTVFGATAGMRTAQGGHIRIQAFEGQARPIPRDACEGDFSRILAVGVNGVCLVWM